MLQIGAIVWGVLDVQRAITFWSQALDYELKYPAEKDWAILVPRSGQGVQLSLNRVTSPAARRHHLDLFTEDIEQDIRRLEALGATHKAWNYEEGSDYVVMQDPEGNPFCLIQPIHNT